MIAKRYKQHGRIKEDFFVKNLVWNLTWGRIYFRVTDENEQPLPLRLNLIAPKKAFRQSVRRHAAKRKVARVLEEMLEQEKLQVGELVIAINPKILLIDEEKIKRDLEFFLDHNLLVKTGQKCGKIAEIGKETENL